MCVYVKGDSLNQNLEVLFQFRDSKLFLKNMVMYFSNPLIKYDVDVSKCSYTYFQLICVIGIKKSTDRNRILEPETSVFGTLSSKLRPGLHTGTPLINCSEKRPKE